VNAVSPTTGRPIPSPGEIVTVRSRHYLVEEVIPPPEPWQQTLVRLSCLQDDAQGTSLQVLWEKEVDAQILAEGAWLQNGKRGFDPPKRFAAYQSAIRWNCTTATNPRLFQSPFRAGIDITFYQLEPLRKALALPRVNLFIADDVGLGKTIEAGLILRELLMRQKVRRVVVSCPAWMLLQWQDELEDRFGLTFVIYNRDFVARTRRERGYATNPWTTHSRFLISHSLLRDEAYAGPLREWLGDFSPGAMLILDEAHNAAPASGSMYGIDSGFTGVIRDISGRFEHRLFLSATPHNGHSNSFSALLEILDPQRFCRGVKVTPRARDTVMVRRLKSDLREIGSNFPKREVVAIKLGGLPPDAPELRLAELLSQYSDLREERLHEADRRVQQASALVISHLQKRLLSSIEAFALTLRVHRRTLARQAGKAAAAATTAPRQLALLREAPGADDDRAELPEDEVRAEEESQVESATAASADAASLTSHEEALLNEMTSIAEKARGEPDPRVRYLIDWIRERMCPALPEIGTTQAPAQEPRWNERRLLIFTEYVDSKRYLEQQLRAVISSTHLGDLRIRTLQGGDSRGREEIKQAFNADPEQHPLRILIATDAAREGLNLQNYCADLFHFDLPWNPSRMEQRNGRIDRKLQRADVVRCHYFIFTQRPEDRVLEVLLKKTETIVGQNAGTRQLMIDQPLGEKPPEQPACDAMLQMEMNHVLVNRTGIFEHHRPQLCLPPPFPQLLIVAARCPKRVERFGPARARSIERRKFPSLEAPARRLHRFERIKRLGPQHSQRFGKRLPELHRFEPQIPLRVPINGL
jgi:Helicase conserved C-terminal domain/SNF2-related domain